MLPILPFLRDAIRDAMPDVATDSDPVPPSDRWQAGVQREGAQRDEWHHHRNAGTYPEVSLHEAAAKAVYDNGKNKRRRYPRVRLDSLAVVIVAHQTGFEWPDGKPKIAEITAHSVIGAGATRYRLHPLNVRLVAANRLNRPPYHAVNVEVMVNAEAEDGSGRWFMPEKFGRGRASDAQIIAFRQEVDWIIGEVASLGGEVIGMLPHRSVGFRVPKTGPQRGQKVPNRHADPGSRIHSEVVEWSGATRGLLVPGPDWAMDGLPIPESWHGRFWPACRNRINRTEDLLA